MNRIGEIWVGHGLDWGVGVAGACFECAEQIFNSLAITPDRLAANAPGIGRSYGDWKRKRSRIRAHTLESMRSFEIIKLVEGGDNELTDWLLWIGLSTRRSSIMISWDPAQLGHASGTMSRLFTSMAEAAGVRYGYLFKQFKSQGPLCYAAGVMYRSGVGYVQSRGDLDSNISAWDFRRISQAGGAILRDVYPENYLGQSHLHSPFGVTGSTLESVLRGDPDFYRIIEPFTDGLTLWKPPVQNIPAIRERMYRAGRLFYWRFMRPRMRDPAGTGEWVPEPYYRLDISQPWEDQGQIPEIFREEFYSDQDPALTL
ncbi:MAG: hypothetical protein H6813_06500 [Phycisphaeraceae bacterium]|nr:hypothetical protein [Phycisphaeraceae bacterium]MCB9848122.1 hypothetical protein [Phycisphaeraceae bacterium]